MLPTLGVDPGRTSGAAVLLDADGRTVLAWWTWCLLRRKGGDAWRVTRKAPGEDLMVDALWEVGRLVAIDVSRCLGEGDPVLVVEGLFVPRARRGGRPVNPQDVVPLAEATGELIGGLRMTPAYRPLATEWRGLTLGLMARTPAADAEAYARKTAAAAFDWPKGTGPATEAERGALAEAAFIARYGWVQQKPKTTGK